MDSLSQELESHLRSAFEVDSGSELVENEDDVEIDADDIGGSVLCASPIRKHNPRFQRKKQDTVVKKTTRAPDKKPWEPEPFLMVTNTATGICRASNENVPTNKPVIKSAKKNSATKAPHNTPARQLYSRSTNVGTNLGTASLASVDWNPIVPKHHKYANLNSIKEDEPNALVVAPFKHTVNNPLKSTQYQRPVSPSQLIKEQTMTATRQVAKNLARQKSATKTPKSGRLLKGKLQPMKPVDLNGPSIQQCEGIQPEPVRNPYSPYVHSHTFRRRQQLLQQLTAGDHMSMVMLQQLASGQRPFTSESVHHTSLASGSSAGTLTDLTDAHRQRSKPPSRQGIRLIAHWSDDYITTDGSETEKGQGSNTFITEDKGPEETARENRLKESARATSKVKPTSALKRPKTSDQPRHSVTFQEVIAPHRQLSASNAGRSKVNNLLLSPGSTGISKEFAADQQVILQNTKSPPNSLMESPTGDQGEGKDSNPFHEDVEEEGNVNNNAWCSSRESLYMPVTEISFDHHHASGFFPKRKMSAHNVLRSSGQLADFRKQNQNRRKMSLEGQPVDMGDDFDRQEANALLEKSMVSRVNKQRPISAVGPAEYIKQEKLKMMHSAYNRGITSARGSPNSLDFSITATGMHFGSREDMYNHNQSNNHQHDKVKGKVIQKNSARSLENLHLQEIVKNTRALTCDVCGKSNFKICQQDGSYERRCSTCTNRVLLDDCQPQGDLKAKKRNSSRKKFSTDFKNGDSAMCDPSEITSFDECLYEVERIREEIKDERRKSQGKYSARFLEELLDEQTSESEEKSKDDDNEEAEDFDTYSCGKVDKHVYEQSKEKPSTFACVTLELLKKPSCGGREELDVNCVKRVMIGNRNTMVAPAGIVVLDEPETLDTEQVYNILKTCGRFPADYRYSSDEHDQHRAIAPYPPLCFRVTAKPPEGHFFYFAYGIDMNQDRFSTYIHETEMKRYWGLLFGFQLKFNKKGKDAEAGCFPNIEFNDRTSVEGVVYKVESKYQTELDQAMGYPEMVVKVVLPVWFMNSESPDEHGIAQYCIPALVYIAKDEWTVKDTTMTNEYAVKQCVQAADLLSPAYKEYLISQINQE